MDEETRAIRTGITETRGELGEAVEELSQRLAPRRQAERIVTERREAARERIRNLSTEDASAFVARARATIAAQPRAAAAVGAVVVLLLSRRMRRR